MLNFIPGSFALSLKGLGAEEYGPTAKCTRLRKKGCGPAYRFDGTRPASDGNSIAQDTIEGPFY